MFEIKEVKPLFNGVVTTAMHYVNDQYDDTNILYDVNRMAGKLNIFQRVVAVGDTVRSVKVGDIVKIRYDRYAVVKHVPGKLEENTVSDNLGYDYNVPRIIINGIEHLKIYDNDIDYIVTDSHIDEGGLLE